MFPRRPLWKHSNWVEVKFTEPPRIANRTDALELLDRLIGADGVIGEDHALEALKDAIEREVA